MDSSPGTYTPAENAQFADDALEQALFLGRFGIIVNQPDRWRNQATFKRVYNKAMQEIDERFGLVPEGFASVPRIVNDQPDCPEDYYETKPFLLSRFVVSNAEFQVFVDGGGYQDMELWPEEIWPHLISFTNRSGQAGPRYWRDSRCDQSLADHPVIGISYYEAAAYARWAGYRLPSEAEWQMAATWCIRSAAHTIWRYPWGDALDLRHCNIWSSGLHKTVPVHAYPSGAAPNGVVQLIGNVWEWTETDFVSADEHGRPIVGDALMKSVRGGAHDTYFPWQATSAFRTGVVGLLRTHNVGFRCAVDLPTRLVNHDVGGQ